MFENSLVESIPRIRTRSRRFAVGTTLLEAAMLAVIVLVPYLYPQALPGRFLRVPLIAPPPAAPVAPPRAAAAAAVQPENLQRALTAPSRIPTRIFHVAINPPGPVTLGNPGSGPAITGSLPAYGPLTPPPPVHFAQPTGPVHVSSGVAQGQLLAPIRPQYPPIALQARIQGAVLVDATISTKGRIENIRVLSGPPMLIPAAVDAIRQARYRPFLLNGRPVEVQTTIRIVFTLDDHAPRDRT